MWHWKRKWFSLVLLNHYLIFQVAAQNMFITDCNNQLILDHVMRNGHTYCSHACGSRAAAVCTAAGDCMCPCSAAPPVGQMEFGDICPPAASDPPDPDPTHLATCQARCLAACPMVGAAGMVCGETSPLPSGGFTFYTTICTCACPMCTTTTTTTTTTSTTTTTPAPTTTTTAVAPVDISTPAKLIIAHKLFFYYLFILLAFKKVIFFSLLYFLIGKELLSWVFTGPLWWP